MIVWLGTEIELERIPHMGNTDVIVNTGSMLSELNIAEKTMKRPAPALPSYVYISQKHKANQGPD